MKLLIVIITVSLKITSLTVVEATGISGAITSIHEGISCRIRKTHHQLNGFRGDIRASVVDEIPFREKRQYSFLNSILGTSKTCIKQIRKFNAESIQTCERKAKETNFLVIGRGGSTATKRKRNNTGFYYGIRDDVFFPVEEPKQELNRQKIKDKEKDTLADVMTETLSELREMREDIMALREEMQYMKEEFRRNKSQYSYEDEPDSLEEEEEEDIDPGTAGSFVQRIKRQKRYDVLGNEIERWAHKLLFEEDGEEFGWKEVKCNKMMRKKFNPFGHTTCYMKWLKDPRGEYISSDDNGQEYPCIKCFATINSPMEDVCKYLSEEAHMPEYNDLVVAYRDLEDISPNAKITWSKCPQILFIKPRDFVTFCHHRYRKDGTQIVLNQACEHEKAPRNDVEEDGKVCRASALRGANFISRDPDDPNKTRMAILAQADPGGGLPPWAIKTAINAVAPIEPFKLFHRIDANVSTFRKSAGYKETNMVNSVPGKCKPAGLSQLGYACFWPRGAGVEKERIRRGNSSRHGHGPGVQGNDYFDDMTDNDANAKEVDKVCIEVNSD